MTRLNTISESEVETIDEDEYDNHLDDSYGEFMGFCASSILKEMDPTAYRCGLIDIQEYKTIYTCDTCGEEFDDEDDALECCT
jgi:hypothetical protein